MSNSISLFTGNSPVTQTQLPATQVSAVSSDAREMSLRLLLPSSPSSSIQSPCVLIHHHSSCRRKAPKAVHNLDVHQRRGRRPAGVVLVGAEDTEVVFAGEKNGETTAATGEDEHEKPEMEPTSEDLEYVKQIRRVLELLRKNRDMLFGEVKLTIMIEDPREVEKRRLLGISESDAPSRDDLVAALVDVNEGRMPKDRIALRMLAEEMINWPNLELQCIGGRFSIAASF
ncbi:hypothetical protein Dimus_015554 [Dionaea muscipula]